MLGSTVKVAPWLFGILHSTAVDDVADAAAHDVSGGVAVVESGVTTIAMIRQTRRMRQGSVQHRPFHRS
jgi:hypothetical protein